MASLKTMSKIAGVALGALAGVAGVAAITTVRRSFAQTSGRLALSGLHAPVSVQRDRWGVPHIYAQNDHDLFMAQGYVHAQDRLWQMELQRRTGHGRLSELFGPIALDSDRFLRVLGFNRVARREAELLAGDARLVVEAYVQGVNAFIEHSARRLPLEFTLLRAHPEPWQAADVLIWAKLMALNLSRGWMTSILRARIVAAVGPERAAFLEPAYLSTQPLTIPTSVRYAANMGEDMLHQAAAAAPFAGSSEVGQGSNAWAVAGTRTATGRPLLANDPHLMIQIPSLWYENHLNGGSFHVTGASIPGLPSIIIGHNEHIAWGVTNGEHDVQDLFVEQFDPADSTRYRFRDAWEQAEVIREPIYVKGQGEPVIETVHITRHGPIVSALLPEGQVYDEAIALMWPALQPSRIIYSALAINRANNWDSFRAALADWSGPAQNFVYADVEGHIGYSLGGDLPIRAKGDGRLPVPGWSGEYEWTGFIPQSELPHVLDPNEGFVVTANTQIAGEGYPYPMHAEWLPGYRAARIRQLIEQSTRHDAHTFARIQSDQRSLPGLELAALAGRLPAPTPIARHAREILAAWDGELTASSVGGAIYARLREHLLQAAYSDVTGPLDQAVGLGLFAELPGSNYLWRALPQLLQRLAARDDSWLPAGRTSDAILAQAWLAALTELTQTLGENVSEWQYGRIHTLTLRHPLSAASPALAAVLNRGPFPIGGDADTVRMGYASRPVEINPFYIAPSYRQICDPGNWDASQSIHPVGQSGQPGSTHYADFVQPWLTMQYHPMLWSRARVEDATVARLALDPA